MRFVRVTALLLFVAGTGIYGYGQEAPRPHPFQAPPRLRQKSTANLQMLRAAQGVPAGTCQPDGDQERDGKVLSVRLAAEVAPNQIFNPGADGGKDNVSLRSYGGCLTGPVIEARPGDTLRLFVHNNLDVNDPSCTPGAPPGPGCFNTVNMHYHGLHVSPTGNSDNVLLNIAPQTHFQYEVNIPEDHPSGTFWYHPHRHGSTSLQVASGASGALIIRGNRPYTGGAPGDIDTILHDAAGKPMPEQILLFQQIPYGCFDSSGKIQARKDGSWYCNPGQVGVVNDFEQQLDSPTVWDMSGRFTSVNGVVQPTLTLPAGQVQRWRMIHAGIHDTVNVQIVPMVSVANNKMAALALQGVLTGTPKEQASLVQQLCPVVMPDGTKPVNLVPQFEVAADGLTRAAINPIGVGQKSVSGGIGSNFMQPGYRSDILVVFPHPGTYCLLNQAATPEERANTGKGGGQGPNETQLLATVVVTPGKNIGGNPPDYQGYVYQALYDGNRQDKGLPPAALAGLQKGDLTPWRGMPDEGPASNSSNPRQVAFFIGKRPSDQQFGFWVNYKEYDPDYVDPNFTLQVGATEDWTLTSAGEPHIFHIHVNPFQVMDVTYKGKSIFGPKGECLVPPDRVGLQNQYCNMWHSFRDTVFVQNDYEVHVRTTYDRYIGEFVLHCHILDHEDSGMMANVLIVPDASQPGGGLGMPGMKMQPNGTMTQEQHQH
jgi:FtsP/CotA-like multicopper oxidase with cupredoxin domain